MTGLKRNPRRGNEPGVTTSEGHPQMVPLWPHPNWRTKELSILTTLELGQALAEAKREHDKAAQRLAELTREVGRRRL